MADDPFSIFAELGFVLLSGAGSLAKDSLIGGIQAIGSVIDFISTLSQVSLSSKANKDFDNIGLDAVGGPANSKVQGTAAKYLVNDDPTFDSTNINKVLPTPPKQENKQDFTAFFDKMSEAAPRVKSRKPDIKIDVAEDPYATQADFKKSHGVSTGVSMDSIDPREFDKNYIEQRTNEDVEREARQAAEFAQQAKQQAQQDAKFTNVFDRLSAAATNVKERKSQVVDKPAQAEVKSQVTVNPPPPEKPRERIGLYNAPNKLEAVLSGLRLTDPGSNWSQSKEAASTTATFSNAKDGASFEVKNDCFSAKNETLETYKAMLTGFQSAYKNSTPMISASEDKRDLWNKAADAVGIKINFEVAQPKANQTNTNAVDNTQKQDQQHTSSRRLA